MEELIHRDYSSRFLTPAKEDARMLAPERSLGSVIKLLTPDEHDYTPEYNAWLDTVPQYIKELVFVVKRYYKPEWGDELARTFQPWTSSTARPAMNSSATTASSSRRYLRVGFDAGRLVAHVRPAQRFPSRRQGADGG